MYIIMALGATQKQGLKRTTAEKELLRSISALEETYNGETNSGRKQELWFQLSELKSNLSGISGKTYTDLRLENAKLRKELDAMKQKLSGLRQENGQQTLEVEHSNPAERLNSLIIQRYSQLINSHEEKTVGDVKALISMEDLTIQSLAQSFTQQNYKFESHYMQAAEHVYNYVKDEIRYVGGDIGVSFWLSPKEIVSEKIGDDEDIAVFLCSILSALGDSEAEVVVAELDDSATHAFVMTSFRGSHFLLDPVQKRHFREFSGQRKDVLEKYSFNGIKVRRFLYRFNREKYERFTEQ